MAQVHGHTGTCTSSTTSRRVGFGQYTSNLACRCVAYVFHVYTSFQGNGSLHLAAFGGYLDVVRALVAAGADMSARHDVSRSYRANLGSWPVPLIPRWPPR
jgi:hypothetical protein